jgi:ABC-type phosphate/phosphonate transport system substrate-binding protein
MIARLEEIGHAGSAEAFFGSVTVSGSHGASLRRVTTGEADASAIDSNALALRFGEEPGLARSLRLLETWGPLPIQPLIARHTLGSGLPGEVAAVLLEMHRDSDAAADLARFGFAHFAPVDPAFYAAFPILSPRAGGEA